MSRKAAAVLHNLAMHSNTKNECFPALKTIAREVKMSVRSVQRALDELLETGLITKKHNYHANGSQTSNIYKIIADLEDRAAAAVSNAQLKLRDMQRRLAYLQQRQAQISFMPSDDSNPQAAHQYKNLLHRAATALKNAYLSRGLVKLTTPELKSLTTNGKRKNRRQAAVDSSL